jgi:hypothetical protein
MNIRRRSLTDSMQLLVDTICNLFGSIVIISLLMAVISKDVPPDASANSHAADLQRQIQQAQFDLAEAQRFQSTIQPKPDDAERLAMADRINQLKSAISSNLTVIRSNSVPMAEPTEGAIPVETLLSKKKALETQLTAATNQLDRLKQANTRQLRLPRERATGKKTYYFICRFGKIFPVHIMLNGRRDLNTQTLDWRQTPDGEIATPRRELGLDPATALPAIGRLFNDIPAQTYSIHFLVYNDSFPAFLATRQIPLARNFDTGWEFFTEDRQVIFSARGEAPPAL